MTPEHDHSRLPKWAQDEIKYLRRDLDHLRKQVSDQRGLTKQTADIIFNYNASAPICLPNEAVRFKIDADTWIDVRMDLRCGVLECNSNSKALHAIAVYPWSGNVVVLKPSDWP